jgi:hypothetical protein
LNAIVLAVQSGIRAIVPAASTSIYALGVKYHVAGGQLFWILLIAVAMGLTPVIRYLSAKAQGIPRKDEDDRA